MGKGAVDVGEDARSAETITLMAGAGSMVPSLAFGSNLTSRGHGAGGGVSVGVGVGGGGGPSLAQQQYADGAKDKTSAGAAEPDDECGRRCDDVLRGLRRERGGCEVYVGRLAGSCILGLVALPVPPGGGLPRSLRPAADWLEECVDVMRRANGRDGDGDVERDRDRDKGHTWRLNLRIVHGSSGGAQG